MSAVGRRPGHADTRGEIVEAARHVFAEKGYDGASLRAIARAAKVDPALVHHYFDGKADLFVTAMALPFDPRAVLEGAALPAHSGDLAVMGFLTMWDQAEGSGSSFASCVGAMAASRNVADALREFVNERVWSLVRNQSEREGAGAAMAERRVALISTQLMGLAFARYLLRVPPLSTATPQEIASWVGPTLDRYMNEPIS